MHFLFPAFCVIPTVRRTATANAIISTSNVQGMTASRRRLATALVMLMIIAPLANAGMASWNTTNTINPNGDELTVTGFRVPGNGTVMDGWVHVTNTDLATAVDPSIILEGLIC